MIDKIKHMLWNIRNYKGMLRLAIDELEFLERQLEHQREEADRIRSLTEKFCKESELDMTSGENWELEEAMRGADDVRNDLKWLKNELHFVINLLENFL